MHIDSQHDADARDLSVAIVVSAYHAEVTESMLSAARTAWSEAGGDPACLAVEHVPGAWELPAVCLAFAVRDEEDRPDAIVALGCVIAGETEHDRYINSAVARGLMEITLQTGVPVGFGVLTCATLAQARARAGGDHGNKGADAIRAAIASARALTRVLDSAARS